MSEEKWSPQVGHFKILFVHFFGKVKWHFLSGWEETWRHVFSTFSGVSQFLHSCLGGGEPGGPWGGHLAGEGEFLPRGRDHFSLRRGKGCPLQRESPSESVFFQKELGFLWAVTVYSGCDKSSSLSCLGSCGFSKVIFRVKRESVDRSTWCTKCSVKCCFYICVHLYGNTYLYKSGSSLFIWFLSK